MYGSKDVSLRTDLEVTKSKQPVVFNQRLSSLQLLLDDFWVICEPEALELVSDSSLEVIFIGKL